MAGHRGAPRRRSAELVHRAPFSRGRAKIAQKLGEEAVEAVIEGVGDNPAALVGESADLLYHLLVLWAAAGISPADVAAEFNDRAKPIGLESQ